MIRPVDLPTLRDEVTEAYVHLGPTVYEGAIRTGKQFMHPIGMSPADAARYLVDAEIRRLGHAELFHVSAEMTQLAVAAGQSLPEFRLMPEDLPTPFGFMVFDQPIDVVEYSEVERSPIVAVSWGPWNLTTRDGNPWPDGGVWLTWWSDREGAIAAAGRALSAARGMDLRKTMPRMLIDNESQVPFTAEPIDWHEKDGIAPWAATLVSTWLLMGQPLASVADAAYDRAARRRIQRQGKEPPVVRVITLRRTASTSGGDSDREYHHQWVVRGHWRQQWLPSRGAHRPTWIAPHIKGPEGAPLLGGEKVYALRR